MVAAATTSLPERSEAGRNYDYRYVWIRDQCYAGRAAATAGRTSTCSMRPSASSPRGCSSTATQLAPAYTVTGGPVPGERPLGLPGYPGGSDNVGNRARISSSSTPSARRCSCWPPPPSTTASTATAGAPSRGRRARSRDGGPRPTPGIWEIDNRQWTHSRLIGAAGLRAIAAHRPGALECRVAAPWPTGSSPTRRARPASGRALAASAGRRRPSTRRCCWPACAARCRPTTRARWRP